MKIDVELKKLYKKIEQLQKGRDEQARAWLKKLKIKSEKIFMLEDAIDRKNIVIKNLNADNSKSCEEIIRLRTENLKLDKELLYLRHGIRMLIEAAQDVEKGEE